MATAVRNPLIEALNRFPILEPAQVEEAARLVETFPQPRALAKELLRREWLTAYQINQIFLDRADDLVFGPYLVINKLGEGGMGNVYKARQRSLDRIVALKVLRPECADNGKALQRFQRETRAVGEVQHPHIVRAYDADVVNGLPYIAMEYIDGVDLARMVKRQGPLAVSPALDFVRQAALGLQHAHDRGLVHRDIKPANLLVSRDTNSTRARAGKFRWGMVKILDLGLVRRTDPNETSLTQLGTVMGTPDFISPEQALNPHTCDGRSDLYSLGCTLYYLLAGRIPFPRGGVTEKLLNHQMHEPEPIGLVRHARLLQESAKTGKRIDDEFYAIPANVEALVRRMMAKRADDRFGNAADLARAIDRLVAPTESDPMSVTHTAALTQTNVVLPPMTPVAPKLNAATTMPMIECIPLEKSGPWRSLDSSRENAPIVNVHMPTSGSGGTRWWLVGALCTVLISATIVFQGQRVTKVQAADPDERVEKRTK